MECQQGRCLYMLAAAITTGLFAYGTEVSANDRSPLVEVPLLSRLSTDSNENNLNGANVN